MYILLAKCNYRRADILKLDPANKYLPFVSPVENKNPRVILFKFSVIRGELGFLQPTNNFQEKTSITDLI